MKPLKINRHLETKIIHFSLHSANVMLIIVQFVGPMQFVVTSRLFNYSKTLLLCKQNWFTVGSESDVLKQNLLRTTPQWFEFGQHSCKLHGLCTVSVWDKKGMERDEKTSKE